MNIPRFDWYALGAWVVLAAALIGIPWLYDSWASDHGRESMSRFMRWVLFTQVAGPIFWGLWIGIPVGVVIHFLLLKR